MATKPSHVVFSVVEPRKGGGRKAKSGRRPTQLTMRGVMEALPWDWNEQRRRFGPAPGINDNLSVRD